MLVAARKFSDESHIVCFRQQALPYVTLLIMLMFFMYAVIGMQVRDANIWPVFVVVFVSS